MTKSLADIGGTTIQNVGPLSPMEPVVHTMSNELIPQIPCNIFLAFKWILMMKSGHNISNYTASKLSVHVWNDKFFTIIWYVSLFKPFAICVSNGYACIRYHVSAIQNTIFALVSGVAAQGWLFSVWAPSQHQDDPSMYGDYHYGDNSLNNGNPILLKTHHYIETAFSALIQYKDVILPV